MHVHVPQSAAARSWRPMTLLAPAGCCRRAVRIAFVLLSPTWCRIGFRSSGCEQPEPAAPRAVAWARYRSAAAGSRGGAGRAVRLGSVARAVAAPTVRARYWEAAGSAAVLAGAAPAFPRPWIPSRVCFVIAVRAPKDKACEGFASRACRGTTAFGVWEWRYFGARNRHPFARRRAAACSAWAIKSASSVSPAGSSVPSLKALRTLRNVLIADWNIRPCAVA